MSIYHFFNNGWARYQKQGKMYSDNFITSFKDDIFEMFERREHDKGKKITSEIMEVDLLIIYFFDYDIP